MKDRMFVGELMPKLKIASLYLEYKNIERVSDNQKQF